MLPDSPFRYDVAKGFALAKNLSPLTAEQSERRTNVKRQMNLGTGQLVSFAQVREQVRLDDAGKWDEVVPRHELRMREGELVLPSSGTERHLQLLPLASGQFAGRLGIPASYWRVLPNELKDRNANYWLQAGHRQDDQKEQGEEHGTARRGAGKPEKWLLRSRFGTVRAVLSEHYSPLDNGSLCETLVPLLESRHRVSWFGLEDEGFHLHIVDPDRVRAVLPGDDYFCGIYIGNSETGTRSVSCEAYLMRLVCSNGLVAMLEGQSLLRRRHIHIESDRFRRTLAEAVQTGLEVADGFIETLRRATTQIVPDPGLTLERLAERWQLSETTQNVARAAIQREAPNVQETCYGVVQGLTEAAQLLPDTARHDLEVLAGKLAENGVPKWALQPAERSDWDGAKARRPSSMEVVA